MKKQSAFTLIELLMVITIIGILTTVVSLDFRKARQTQELATLADQSLALLQQTHAEVAAGKTWTVEDENGVEEIEMICMGGYFRVGEIPLLAKGTYLLDDESCSAEVLEDYGFTTTNALVESIEVGSTSLDQIYVYFEPPTGDVAFYSGGKYVGDAVINLAHVDNEDLELDLEINYLTGQFALSRNDYEE